MTTLAADGEPVTITLDDRSRTGPDSADNPDGTTPPASDPPEDGPETTGDTPPPAPSE